MNRIVFHVAGPVARHRTGLCEHKGHGHPDCLCDGVAALSMRLARGEVRVF